MNAEMEDEMASEAEKQKQKQREVQAELDAMPGHGWERLVKLKPLNSDFDVQFKWIDEALRSDAKGRRTSENESGGWKVLLPNDVYEVAFERLKSGDLDTTNTGKHGKRHLPIVKGILAAWEQRQRTPDWVDGNPAAALLNAARRTSQIRVNGYRDFRFEHKGVFVEFAHKESTPKTKEKESIDDVDPAVTGLMRSKSPSLLERSTNVVLEGVPGTGKTHAINALNVAYDVDAKPIPGTGIRELRSATGRSLPAAAETQFVPVEVRFMTMHPSTSYEDFVEGLRPAGDWTNSTATQKVTNGKSADLLPGPWFHEKTNSTTTDFALKNGFFVEACVAAVADPNKAIVVVLDELNRCNIPKVLGDLMTVTEESKRAHWDGTAWVVDSDTKAVTLPYSGRKLLVPDNLFIVGTMNTTDRSVAPMDAALRRRFAFHRIWPQGFGPDAVATAAELEKRLGTSEEITKSLHLWRAINALLLAKYGSDAMLGHSYLDDLSRALKRTDANAAEVVAYHWNHRILPQLMDVIASNGLTRSLVNDPRAFFDQNPKAKAGTGTLASPATVFNGRIDVSFSGTGSQRMAHLTFLKLEQDPPSKQSTNGLGTPDDVAASDDAAGDE
jgi:MoxR-like ATPase